MALGATTANQVQAIHVRQPKIDDKTVVNFLAGQRQRRLRVGGGVHLIAGFGQAAIQELANCGVIFNHQKSHSFLVQQIRRCRRLSWFCFAPFIKYPSFSAREQGQP